MARKTEELEKQGFHHGNLRETASGIAYQKIKKEGLESLNLRGIAAECGVDHSALYRHFRNRDSLLATVILRGFRELNSFQEKSKAATSGDFLENYVEFAFRSKNLYILMFSETGRKFYKDTDIEAEIQKLIRMSAETIGNLSPGERISNELRDRVMRAWAFTHGFIDLWQNGLFKASSDKLAKQYILHQVKLYTAQNNNWPAE